MERELRKRFLVFATLLVLFGIGGMVSLPFLQQCCSDPLLPWPEPLNRSLLEQLLFMDMAPRLAALATAAGTASLFVLLLIYVATARMLERDVNGRTVTYLVTARALAAAFMVGILYLWGFFLTGYFQLG